MRHEIIHQRWWSWWTITWGVLLIEAKDVMSSLPSDLGQITRSLKSMHWQSCEGVPLSYYEWWCTSTGKQHLCEELSSPQPTRWESLPVRFALRPRIEKPTLCVWCCIPTGRYISIGQVYWRTGKPDIHRSSGTTEDATDDGRVGGKDGRIVVGWRRFKKLLFWKTSDGAGRSYGFWLLSTRVTNLHNLDITWD